MPNGYNSIHTGQWHDNQLTIAEVFDRIYPVGSIYISVNDTNPSVLFGGTWEQITGRFLLATGYPGNNTYDGFGAIKQPDTWHVYPEQTGGEDYHTLTINETPAHTHTRGTMDITGKIEVWTDYNKGNSDFDTECVAGAFHFKTGTDWEAGVSTNASGGNYDAERKVNFTASRSWTGETSSVGGNEAHNNMPPYFGVNMWQRTE